MKKRYGLLLICIILNLFTMFGCGATENKKENEYADKEFITALQDVLEKRWDAADKFEEDKADKYKIQKTYESFIDIELSKLEFFKDRKFEDSILQEKTIKYIDVLNDSKESLSYMNADFFKSMELYKKDNNERAKLISNFVNDYGLKFDDKYSSTLNDFLINAKDVK